MKMEILGKFSVKVIAHAGALEMLVTIFLCYGLAVGCGHVKPWLPMISDCAVLAPEKYPFRLGFVVGAVLIAMQTVAVSGADKRACPTTSKTSLALGTVSAFCLAVVGVVNEDECNPVHSGAAVGFFVLYEINMVFLTWYSPLGEAEGHIQWSHILRQLCAIVAGVALVAFIIMSTNWGKYSLPIAICEWTGTFCIILFNWSFAGDLGEYYIAETKGSPDPAKWEQSEEKSSFKNSKLNIL